MEVLLEHASKSKFCLIASEMLIVATSLGGSFLLVMSLGFLTKTLESPGVVHARVKAGETVVRLGDDHRSWFTFGEASGSLLELSGWFISASKNLKLTARLKTKLSRPTRMS